MNLVYPHFLSSEIISSPMSESMFTVIPVPYEKTVSYAVGTKLGPSSILQASEQLETWDGYSNPSAHGIHTYTAIDCEIEETAVLEQIAKAVTDVVSHQSIPVVLGGEHTVTYGVINGLLAAGYHDFAVVQIDAHADLRDSYQGSRLSHACVMKRITDLEIPIYQLGIRALSEEEVFIREKKSIYFKDAEELVKENLFEITLPDDFPAYVFFTLDIDGMDPSVFPSTGTPVPGGLSWYQTLSLFESVARQRKIIGFDVMEFAPIKGFHAYDFSAALLVYKMMGIVERSLALHGFGA